MQRNRPFSFESQNEGEEAIKAAAYEAQNKSNLRKETIQGNLYRPIVLLRQLPQQ
jgi:hypothetical protein